MRKLTPARVSYRDDFLILYRVYIMTESFHISLFEGTLHVDKIQVWFKIANITRALPIPVYRQTDFMPKRVVVSHLHDTAMRFCTRVKFSPRYKNRGELTLGWLAPAWHFVVVSCNKCRAMRGNRSELAPARKSPRCHSPSLVSNCTRQVFLTMSKPPGSFWNFIIEQNWLIIEKPSRTSTCTCGRYLTCLYTVD